MDLTKRMHWSMRFSARLYQALLHLYPTAFRKEYGWLMAQAFGDCCHRVVRQLGPAGLIPLWGQTIIDILVSAITEHTQKGVNMTKEKWFKLSGWAFILGSLSFFTGWLASTRPTYHPNNYFSLPIDQIANKLTAPTIFAGLLLVSLGMVGLLIRFAAKSSPSGRFALAGGVFFGLVTGTLWGLGMIGLQFAESEAIWNGIMISMVLQLTGLALWGVECLRERFLPRGNFLALLAGLPLPLFLLAGVIIQAATGSLFAAPDLVSLIILGTLAAGLVGLGFQLQAVDKT
jgi:hypothetical protein